MKSLHTVIWSATWTQPIVLSRQTGHKKKLNTFISFPEQLDMGPFLDGKQGISNMNLCDTLCFSQLLQRSMSKLTECTILWFEGQSLFLTLEARVDKNHWRLIWRQHFRGCTLLPIAFYILSSVCFDLDFFFSDLQLTLSNWTLTVK